MNTRNRHSKVLILFNYFKFFRECLSLLLVLIPIGMMGDSTFSKIEYVFTGGILLLTIIGIILILPLILALISWKRNIYILKDNSIVFETGVFNKKISEIPMKKISTIDISQNLISSLFNVATLKIDTEEAVSKKEEGKILLNKARINEIRDYIQDFRGEKEDLKEVVKEYRVRTRDLFLYSLNLKVLGLLYGIYVFVDNIFDDYMKRLDLSVLENKIESYPLGISILALILLVVIILIILVIISMIFNYIKYYDFKLSLSKSAMHINYGIVNKQDYNVNKANIKAVYLEENLLSQIFKRTSIKIEVIGYGDEEKEVSLLHPMIDKQTAIKLIKENFSYLYFEGDAQRSPKSSKIRYFVFDIVLYLFISIITIVVYKELVLSSTLHSYHMLIVILALEFIYFIIRLGSCNLRYKNNSMAVYGDNVYISSGGYRKRTSFIRKKAVQAVTYTQNIFQRKKNLMNVKVDIHSNRLESFKVLQLDMGYREKISIK